MAGYLSDFNKCLPYPPSHAHLSFCAYLFSLIFSCSFPTQAHYPLPSAVNASLLSTQFLPSLPSPTLAEEVEKEEGSEASGWTAAVVLAWE